MGFRQNSVVFNKNIGHSIDKLQLSSKRFSDCFFKSQFRSGDKRQKLAFKKLIGQPSYLGS
jgi:hypothetical protein